MKIIQEIFILALIFGGFLGSIFSELKIGLACMCMGIWFTQLLYETKQEERMEYHIKKLVLSPDQLSEKIFGYTLFELKKIIDFAKSKGYEKC